MPYRHAHIALLIVFPLAAAAFWSSYLSRFATASAEFHLHGVTATLWLALVVMQSLLIHSGRRAGHRTLGIASLAIFPLFLAGGVGIFIGMARRFVEEASPFYALYAPSLAWIDLVTVAGFAWLYFQALVQRRNIVLHAGYMLATVIFLLPPILGRLAPVLPPLAISGPQDFGKLGIGFQLANVVAIVLALAVAAAVARVRGRRSAKPWVLAAAFTAVAALMFQFVGPLPAWRALFVHVAELPTLPVCAAVAVLGVIIALAGWQAGRLAGTPAPAPA